MKPLNSNNFSDSLNSFDSVAKGMGGETVALILILMILTSNVSSFSICWKKEFLKQLNN